MQVKRLILAVLILVCGLTFAACDRAPESAAQLYEDIYTATEPEKLGTIETKRQIIQRFEEAGLSAVDSDNRINMVNWEPVDEFESVIQEYLGISREQIRSRTEYDASDNTYIFSSRTAEAKGSTPDMPCPEVVEITDNGDGTITLRVEAVWPKYKDDRAFVHEVTVRNDGEGFKYIANKVVEKKMETSWYVGR